MDEAAGFVEEAADEVEMFVMFNDVTVSVDVDTEVDAVGSAIVAGVNHDGIDKEELDEIGLDEGGIEQGVTESADGIGTGVEITILI